MGYVDTVEHKGAGASLQRGLLSLLVGLSLVAVSLACMAMLALRRNESQRRRPRVVEKRRDDALKQTFPASDAPASQYFDIPANRL